VSYALVKAGSGGESLYYLPDQPKPFIFPPAWKIPPGAIVLPVNVTILGGQNVRFAALPEGAPIRVAIPCGVPARLWWRLPLSEKQKALIAQAAPEERDEVTTLLTKECRYTFPLPPQRSPQQHERSLAKVRTAQARTLGIHPAEMHQRERKAQLEGYVETPAVPIPPASHPSWRERLFGARGT
jgi:hypothetical protein